MPKVKMSDVCRSRARAGGFGETIFSADGSVL